MPACSVPRTNTVMLTRCNKTVQDPSPLPLVKDGIERQLDALERPQTFFLLL